MHRRAAVVLTTLALTIGGIAIGGAPAGAATSSPHLSLTVSPSTVQVGREELAPFSAPGVTKGRGWIANWSCDSWRLGHHGDPRNLDMLCQRIAITCL